MRAGRSGPHRIVVVGCGAGGLGLVSLGEHSTVGNLMGSLTGANLRLEGTFARMMDLSLRKMHECALRGFWKMAPDTPAWMALAAPSCT